MRWDAHIHTFYSGDCQVPATEMIESAKKIGLNGMTITDHMDLDYTRVPGYFFLDLPLYHDNIPKLQEQYNDDTFHLCYGIELGLSEEYIEDNLAITKKYPFDYCIGSIHVVNHEDMCYDDYYEGHEMNARLTEYFETTLSNIKACDYYDSLGHLDYIMRYAGMYCQKNNLPAPKITCMDVIEEILLTLIKKDKALEINTGAFRCDLVEPNPPYEIIKRYLELGGKLITMGSDAHISKHVGLAFDEVIPKLNNLGIKSIYVYKNRIPTEIPLA